MLGVCAEGKRQIRFPAMHSMAELLKKLYGAQADLYRTMRTGGVADIQSDDFLTAQRLKNKC